MQCLSTKIAMYKCVKTYEFLRGYTPLTPKFFWSLHCAHKFLDMTWYDLIKNRMICDWCDLANCIGSSLVLSLLKKLKCSKTAYLELKYTCSKFWSKINTKTNKKQQQKKSTQLQQQNKDKKKKKVVKFSSVTLQNFQLIIYLLTFWPTIDKVFTCTSSLILSSINVMWSI